jgi:hypothetical protein
MPLLSILATMDRPVLAVPHWELVPCPEVRFFGFFQSKGLFTLLQTQYAPETPPRTFNDLRKLFARGLARPFHTSPGVLLGKHRVRACPNCSPNVKASWSPGIRTTNYAKWFQASTWAAGFFALDVDGDPDGADKAS